MAAPTAGTIQMFRQLWSTVPPGPGVAYMSTMRPQINEPTNMPMP
jgi:hypothetical protein